MKKFVKSLLPKKFYDLIKVKSQNRSVKKTLKNYAKKFNNKSFSIYDKSITFEQYKARITKAYHSIEKGLSYTNLRLGFGQSVLNDLLELLNRFKNDGYDMNQDFIQTALSVLKAYITIHNESAYPVEKLEKSYNFLKGICNDSGGFTNMHKSDITSAIKKDFREFSLSRHSVRTFSDEPIDKELIIKAIKLAQSTPSACNRQSWKIRVVNDKNLKNIIAMNQNGNRGFHEQIDKILVITSDAQYFSKPLEVKQPFIDGGMYAMNVLYALHYFGVASVPLSAAINQLQEKNIRKHLKIDESEEFILFIGIGNYLDSFRIAKSSRRNIDIEIL